MLNPPFSTVVMCPTLVAPANGSLVLSGNTFGETANYTCDTGFILEGDSTLTCGSDGQWIGSPLVCNRKKVISAFILRGGGKHKSRSL